MKFAIDLDSTLVALPVVERACQDLGLTGFTTADVRDWCFTTFPDNLRQRIYELFDDSDFMCTLKPNDGSQYFIRNLIRCEHDVWIVTNRSQHMHDRTFTMISELFPGTTAVTLAADKSKLRTYLAIKPDVVIDDSPANVAFAVMAGVKTVILYSDESTPYNHRLWGGFNCADMTELVEIAEDDKWNEVGV